MPDQIERYIRHIQTVRRYSPRTVDIYASALKEFAEFVAPQTVEESLNTSIIRSYEVHLMDSRGLDPRTVTLHLSVLSGFCRFLVKQGLLESNPIRTVPKPKTEKRLPVVFRKESMDEYFRQTQYYGSDVPGPEAYRQRLSRLIMLLLYTTGMRRAELVGLDRSSLNLGRRTLRVHGKGDKVRELPLVKESIDELSLYLNLCARMGIGSSEPDSPLLVTEKGNRLYPAYVDRVVKAELQGVQGVTMRRSPHVLRHTIATELLEGGADISSIKEMLGHSSLAATQVYTHNSVEKLKKVYMQAHPLAKKEQ